MKNNKNIKINLLRAVLIREIVSKELRTLEFLCEINNKEAIKEHQRCSEGYVNTKKDMNQKIQSYVETLNLIPYKHISLSDKLVIPMYNVEGFSFSGLAKPKMDVNCSAIEKEDILSDSDIENIYNICHAYSESISGKDEYVDFVFMEIFYINYKTFMECFR